MTDIRDIIRRAEDIESRAAYDYSFGLARIASYGLPVEDLKNIINRVAVDTIIHKHLVRGILEALNELEKMNQSISDIEERRVELHEIPEDLKTVFRRFLERHLEIERNMISVYRELAEKADHPVVKALAEKLAENEKEHHRYLSELISKL